MTDNDKNNKSKPAGLTKEYHVQRRLKSVRAMKTWDLGCWRHPRGAIQSQNRTEEERNKLNTPVVKRKNSMLLGTGQQVWSVMRTRDLGACLIMMTMMKMTVVRWGESAFMKYAESPPKDLLGPRSDQLRQLAAVNPTPASPPKSNGGGGPFGCVSCPSPSSHIPAPTRGCSQLRGG